MTSVQTKIDMAINYINYLSCELNLEEFRKFYAGVFREVGLVVKAQCETVVKELNNDRPGAGVSEDAGRIG